MQTSHAWFKAWQSGGQAALKSKGKPGPVPMFDDSHRRHLAQLLAQGPQAHGYDNALWSLLRVRAVVAEHLGIRASITSRPVALTRVSMNRHPLCRHAHTRFWLPA
jgi:transposase